MPLATGSLAGHTRAFDTASPQQGCSLEFRSLGQSASHYRMLSPSAAQSQIQSAGMPWLPKAQGSPPYISCVSGADRGMILSGNNAFMPAPELMSRIRR